MTTKVLIADGEPLVRTGLRHHLQAEPDLDVAEAAGGDQAVAASRLLRPDVVLIDLGASPDANVSVIGRLARLPEDGRPAVIALAATDDAEHLYAALRAGAVGYVLKSSDPDLFTQSVRHVASGRGFIDPHITRRLIHRFAELSPGPAPAPAPHVLTPREREVLCHLARGMANRAIARDLGISEGTVKLHVNRILGKLLVSSRVQATIYAHRHGLTSADWGVPCPK
ncbi:LuxR C-terminal-related transcriptional regulator [Spirillospora sp. CA-294931]|uniref:LuxR C-terminal-related transcriptional regulator n=1 Tax=Spirillospora sp. CA-294931 TaxID=3240042 RepID=UPI003D9180E4